MKERFKKFGMKYGILAGIGALGLFAYGFADECATFFSHAFGAGNTVDASSEDGMVSEGENENAALFVSCGGFLQ